MAQVTVPRLQRIQPSQANPQNDRINLQAKDQGSAILNQTNQVVKVADQVGEIYQKYENDKIETLSATAELEYSAWNKEQLGKLKNYQGDPTDAYVEYEKLAQEKKQSILDSRPDLNDRVKRHFTSRLETTVGKQQLAANFQRGAQQETYEHNTFEATVKNKKDNIPAIAGYIQKGDPSSYSMLDDELRDMSTTIIKRGLKQGTVTQLPDDAEKYGYKYADDDGKEIKVSIGPMTKQRLAKETSESLKNSIDALIAGGRIEEAKEMNEKYKLNLDPKSQTALDNKFKKAGRKDEAYSLISNLRGKSEEVQIEEIEKIQDPELRSEALKIKDADDKRITAMRNRKEKVNYDTLAKNVMQKMTSDNPYHGIADLENDPIFKNTFENMSAKQQKVITEMVEAPKESNSKSEMKVMNLFMDGSVDSKIETMSPEDFAEYTVGLSKSDKQKYTNMYVQLRSQSEGERRATYKNAGNILRDQFLIDDHIARNDFGKIAGEDELTLLRAQKKLATHMADYPGIMNEKQLRDFVKEFSVAEIKGKAFKPTVKTPKTVSNTDNRSATIPDKETNIELKRRFRTEKGYFPSPTDAKWIEFVKRNTQG